MLPLAIIASLLGAGELVAMLRKLGHEPIAWTIYVGTLITVLAAGAPGLLPNRYAGTTTGQMGWLALGLAASLLVAMVGAIVLTLQHKSNVKRQDVVRQTSRRREEATELVKVKSGQGI